jgi:flavodoxin
MTKNKLYYFSGTGNSLAVAKKLAQALGDTEIFSIAEVINKKFDFAAERIGIIFPVYIWGLPLIVSRFAEKIQLPANVYLFGVATYAISGEHCSSCRIFLKQRNIEMAAVLA